MEQKVTFVMSQVQGCPEMDESDVDRSIKGATRKGFSIPRVWLVQVALQGEAVFSALSAADWVKKGSCHTM